LNSKPRSSELGDLSFEAQAMIARPGQWILTSAALGSEFKTRNYAVGARVRTSKPRARSSGARNPWQDDAARPMDPDLGGPDLRIRKSEPRVRNCNSELRARSSELDVRSSELGAPKPKRGQHRQPKRTRARGHELRAWGLLGRGFGFGARGSGLGVRSSELRAPRPERGRRRQPKRGRARQARPSSARLGQARSVSGIVVASAGRGGVQFPRRGWATPRDR
jgi:hypothetical protein